jgi:hypothetical protein
MNPLHLPSGSASLKLATNTLLAFILAALLKSLTHHPGILPLS